MAFDQRALIGRPGLRRALGGLDSEGEAAFRASVADIDPRRFRSLYRQRAEQFLDNERQFTRLRDAGALQERENKRRRLQRDYNFASPSSGRSLMREY